MKNNSFLVTIVLALSFNNLNCGQVGSRPILDPLDLLKIQTKKRGERHPKKNKLSLQKNQPGLLVQLPVLDEYETHLQQPCHDYSSDNFFQVEVPAASTRPVQKPSLSKKKKTTVIAYATTIAATYPIKRDVPLVCSDDSLDNTDRLVSPENEQPKRSHPEAFQELPTHFVATNDFLIQ